MKILLTAFVILSLIGATTNEGAMHIIYIDSSQPVTEDFFSGEEYVRLQKLLADLANEKVFIFYSNGERYLFARDEAQQEKILENLLTTSSQEPQLIYDKKLMRDYLFSEMQKFSGTLNMHFFLSDYQTAQVASGEHTLVKLFPKELYEVGNGNVSSVNVDLYFDNVRGKIKEEKLTDALNFFNNADYKPVINFKINLIK